MRCELCIMLKRNDLRNNRNELLFAQTCKISIRIPGAFLMYESGMIFSDPFLIMDL